jgi:hypothetical protein
MLTLICSGTFDSSSRQVSQAIRIVFRSSSFIASGQLNSPMLQPYDRVPNPKYLPDRLMRVLHHCGNLRVSATQDLSL